MEQSKQIKERENNFVKRNSVNTLTADFRTLIKWMI